MIVDDVVFEFVLELVQEVLDGLCSCFVECIDGVVFDLVGYCFQLVQVFYCGFVGDDVFQYVVYLVGVFMVWGVLVVGFFMEELVDVVGEFDVVDVVVEYDDCV